MNKSETKTSIFSLIILLVLALAIIFLVYKFLTPQKKLPVYNPQDMNPALVDSTLQSKGKGHRIADFKLINQNGEIITQENYKGKIYVADFFFTRCTTICPVMTSNMKEVQDAFLDNDKVMFLSHSVTPEMDSVPVLRAYADIKGVIDGKWNITTGDKKHIYALARKSYFAVLDEGDGGLQDFVHTENFTLIDPKGQIRGTYDGTDKAEIQRLIADIRILLKE
jgi:protein SCO1/2